MIRVDIESIVMASGPVPSVIVLRERKPDVQTSTPPRALSIQTGTYEAASIGHGADSDRATPRPITHDLLLKTIKELGAKMERVEIRRWDAPVFYADIVLKRDNALPQGDQESCTAAGAREIRIDARPSDALALATRSNAPIYVEDDVMNRAGNVPIPPNDTETAVGDEIERFDEFVRNLSPDDF